MECKSCYLRGCSDKQVNTESNQNVNTDSYSKLNTQDWLEDIPKSAYNKKNYVEIRFKNTRKDFYNNVNDLNLKKGDIVAVEASPGHDIGIVSLTGELVYRQMKKYGFDEKQNELRKIYRKARSNDIEKWVKAMDREHETMIKSRQIADELGLDMKIGDVEYQGDNTKAIFYYIADERVDFRKLIKVLAENFKVRIEMKQIGARQEAGRIGGIGPCGRELCCSSWMNNFVSITTNFARYQHLSLNPQKIAGQCSKLKCCLVYELDSYLDAQKDFPSTDIELETREGTAYYIKTDVYNGIMWYSFDKYTSLNVTPVPVERVKEIIALNKKNKIVEKLILASEVEIDASLDFNNASEGSITRFDKKSKKKKRKNSNRRKKNKPNARKK